MNGVRVAVHQSSRRSDSRKLFSITRSPSAAVVSEMAPMWMTASSLRLSSQAINSEIVLHHQVAVGGGGVGNGAHVDDRLELAAVEPGHQFGNCSPSPGRRRRRWCRKWRPCG